MPALSLSLITSFINKILYYCNPILHVNIIKDMVVVMLNRRKGYYLAVPVSSIHVRKKIDVNTISRIHNYCGLWLRIRRKMGLHDSCYFKSAFLCRVLRKAGIDSRLNFGTKKSETNIDGWEFIGHCWVSCGSECRENEFPFVFQYPSEETV